MEPDKIQALTARMHEYVSEKEFAGISLLYQEKGFEPVFLSAGYADLEEKRPMARDTIFHLYSQTKPITAAAAMLLIQDGVLDLYDPAAKFFPSFLHQSVQTDSGPVPAAHPVTIRDLLNMTSGLVYPETRTQAEAATGLVFSDLLARLDSDHPMTTGEFADRIGQCKAGSTSGGVSAEIGEAEQAEIGCTSGDITLCIRKLGHGADTKGRDGPLRRLVFSFGHVPDVYRECHGRRTV